ncbi:MAG TPA: phosphatase PAP2/dual specificity phosphatase family protein [Cellvibrionaceae bacterium]|nr:phosphatase PAP2/dual specificity phosphatase family protein [Cellvibrionaceae bacterium]
MRMFTGPIERVEATAGGILWGRSLLWLAFLGPFFFITYGMCNLLAKQRGITASIAFSWEHSIPVIPWTVIPYWSIDLLYGLSFMLCRGARQVDRHALRLLTAQLISIAFFISLPLRFSFERPVVEGFFGPFFKVLTGMDEPYNQAPSLHISLLIIIWAQLCKLPAPWRWGAHIWCGLIALSVLTTHQHHFFDLPSGAAVGLLCLWLWPERTACPLSLIRQHQSVPGLAGLYACSALAACLLAAGFGGWAWWLLWPAIALALLAGMYGAWGAAGFQKYAGQRSLAVEVLLLPYTLAAWLNSRLWTRRAPAPVQVAEGVWLGRAPDAGCLRRHAITYVLDLAPELPTPEGPWQVHSLPWLDLVAPSTQQLIEAAQAIETHRRQGPILVACALGYSRSASAVIAWLLSSGRCLSLAEAEAAVRAAKPAVVLGPAHRAALAAVPARQDHAG